MRIVIKKLSEIKPHPKNARRHSSTNIEIIKRSLQEYGQRTPIVIGQDNHILKGCGTYQAFLELAWPTIKVVKAEGLTLEQELAYALMDNKSSDTSEFDHEKVKDVIQFLDGEGFDLDNTGFHDFELEALLDGTIDNELPQQHTTLAERFIIPPFSVLDARQGYWQDRKRAWVSLGIQGELGRGGNQESKSIQDHEWLKSKNINKPVPESHTGTSIFDPVLTELIYKWFCPNHGYILDPFAGGSVRGIVAGYLGYKYIGIDLSPEQVDANMIQSQTILKKNHPKYIVGDALDSIPLQKVDLIFSCPPYHDLEVYTNDERDLSNMDWEGFKDAYYKIIISCIKQLKQDRFACFVVGDIRNEEGIYKNLPGETIDCFISAGAELYNEAILITAVGSLPIRVGKQFESYRKLGKTHQNVLVFYKGNPKNIPKYFKDVTIEKIDTRKRIK
jgi:DNA modification methylase